MRCRPPLLALLAGALLAGCGSTPPSRINDICAVFSQRDGLFVDWYADAKKAEAKHGVPLHVLMATMRVESGFDGDARPPRGRILGFIPGQRPSTAFGYSQALDGTWAQYRRETRQASVRRTDFGASVDFIGWYHAKTIEKYGVAQDDIYSLYLSYHSGWTGYARGTYRARPEATRTAQKAASLASAYQVQLQNCR